MKVTAPGVLFKFLTWTQRGTNSYNFHTEAGSSSLLVEMKCEAPSFTEHLLSVERCVGHLGALSRLAFPWPDGTLEQLRIREGAWSLISSPHAGLSIRPTDIVTRTQCLSSLLFWLMLGNMCEATFGIKAFNPQTELCVTHHGVFFGGSCGQPEPSADWPLLVQRFANVSLYHLPSANWSLSNICQKMYAWWIFILKNKCIFHNSTTWYIFPNWIYCVVETEYHSTPEELPWFSSYLLLHPC